MKLLDLYHVNDTDIQELACALIQSIRHLPRITVHIFGSIQLGPRGFVGLGIMLQIRDFVHCLKLSEMTRKDMPFLVASIAASSLKCLDMTYNFIDWRCTMFLSEALRVNSSLTELGLKGHKMGDKGVIALSRALRTSSFSKLLIINLSAEGSDTPFGPAGANELSEYILVSSLTYVDISHNKLGNGPGPDCVSALSSACIGGKLTRFDVSFCGFTVEQKERLSRALEGRTQFELIL